MQKWVLDWEDLASFAILLAIFQQSSVPWKKEAELASLGLGHLEAGESQKVANLPSKHPPNNWSIMT